MIKRIFSSISEGLIHTLPIILIGSFALVFKSLPIPAYQTFLQVNIKAMDKNKSRLPILAN